MSTGEIPAVRAAMASLAVTDPNPFRAARAPGTRALYEALKSAPMSLQVTTPKAMHVSPAPYAELSPIFQHLSQSAVASDTNFPRGATFQDGRLDMCKQVVGPEHIDDLATAVRCAGASSPIEHFLIGNNIVGDAGAANIAAMAQDPNGPRLKTLYLAGNAFGPKGAQALSTALANNTSVQGLWLKRNPLGPNGAAALGEMLARNTAITTLDLVNTGLLDEGVEALFDGLADNQTLRTLYLDANGLTPRGARAIAAYFDRLHKQKRTGLTGLFLGVNRLECEGACILARALAAYGRLERFDIGANRVELDGLKALLEMAKATPPLRYLGLGFYKSASDMGELPNWFGDAGAELIANHVASETALQAIEVKDAHIGPDGLALLGDAVERQPALFELSAAQLGLKQQGLFQRIERFLSRNVRAGLGISLGDYRNGPLRVLKHGPDIHNIASIYRNVM